MYVLKYITKKFWQFLQHVSRSPEETFQRLQLSKSLLHYYMFYSRNQLINASWIARWSDIRFTINQSCYWAISYIVSLPFSPSTFYDNSSELFNFHPN